MNKKRAAHRGLVVFSRFCLFHAAAKETRVIIPGATSKSIDNPYQTRQPGGNLFEQSLLIFLDCLIIRLGERLHIDFSRLSQLHANLE